MQIDDKLIQKLKNNPKQDPEKNPTVITVFFDELGQPEFFATGYNGKRRTFTGFVYSRENWLTEIGEVSRYRVEDDGIPPYHVYNKGVDYIPKPLVNALRERNLDFPLWYRKYINFDIPKTLDPEIALKELVHELKLYIKAKKLTKRQAADLDADSVNQGVYEMVCDNLYLSSSETRNLAKEIMHYHFWETLEKITGGMR